MFENYTERARRVIFFARYEASQLWQFLTSRRSTFCRALLARTKPSLTASSRTRQSRPFISRLSNTRALGPKRPLPSICLEPRSQAGASYVFGRVRVSVAQTHRNRAPAVGVFREDTNFAAELLRSHGVQLKTLRERIAQPDFGVEKKSFRRGPEVSIVSFTSSPTGAEIYLNDKFLGNTPAEIPLTAGEWAVRLIKNGFEPWEKKLLVMPAAKQTIAVDLTPLAQP